MTKHHKLLPLIFKLREDTLVPFFVSSMLKKIMKTKQELNDTNLSQWYFKIREKTNKSASSSQWSRLTRLICFVVQQKVERIYMYNISDATNE